MTSYHIDSVVRELDWLCNHIFREQPLKLDKIYPTLKLNLQFLETFLVCARKWKNSGELVSLQLLLSKIEVTINKHGRGIQSLRSERDDDEDLASHFVEVVSNFLENIRSFKQEIIELYSNLPDFIRSSQSNSCMGDEELVGFIDSILQNLVDLLGRLSFDFMEDYNTGYNTALHAHIEALEDKLTFLKNFIRFAKLRGVQHNQFEDLLVHTQIAALDAARLSYMCLFYQEDEEVRSPKMCSFISDLLQKIKPINRQICEIYIQVLRASNSTSPLLTEKMDKRAVQDFNDSIISCLWELLCGANFLVSVKDQMHILYEGLRFLRSILREPYEKMDALAENIVAVIGEAGIVICSLFAREVDVDSAVVRDCPDCCATLVTINNNIKHMKAQISSLSAIGSIPSYHSFKAQEIHKTSRLMPSKVKIPVTHEVVVGFDEKAQKLFDRLVGGSRDLEIIPIIGMPGLGKTTLAKQVYNNPKTLLTFHVRLWCIVSQVYNKKNLLLQILRSNGKHSKMKDTLDEHQLLEQLRKDLMRNRYLVVFDDVWDVKVWDDLRHAFPNDKNGSRILFTSRISHVASQIDCARGTHKLDPLNDGDSWELIQKKVFGKGDCPQALHEIGMKIAKICKGLPLTVVAVAGILATIEYDGWDEVAESLISTTVYGTDQCKNTLELSYMHLPHYLKPCLLYFGAFREDQEIQSKKVMRLWIAEGLVQNIDHKSSEDLAEEYMLDLIGRNLVMVAKQRSRGGVRACQIHDLLHEFCKEKAKEENFLRVLHGYDELSIFNESPNLRRLSIWSEVDHFKKSRLFCPHISSLLLFNQFEETKEFDAFMADVSFIFCIYKGLRVLDLEKILLKHDIFPGEVESLVELRYLGVQGQMGFIPPSIAKLSNLETFRVINGIVCVSLPKTIWNMTKLRHLHIDGSWGSGCSLPSENLENNSYLLSLQTFSTPIIPLDRVENTLSKIRNVRQLKIRLSEAEESTTAWDFNFNGLESRLSEAEESTAASDCNCSGLESRLSEAEESTTAWDCNFSELESQLSEVEESTTAWDCNFSGLESLESLQVSMSIEEDLLLKHVEFSFPSTLKKLVLAELKLPWSKITLIEKLPNLEVLKLLCDSFDGEKWELTEGGFLKLRFLKLHSLDVVDWTDTGSDDHFPRLQKLLLSDIAKLESLPSCLERISNLELIEVRYCEDSVKDLVRKIEEEQQSYYGKEKLKVLTVDDY